MLKGLSGSGWHLCAIMMRMMFDGFIKDTASLGSPGVNEMRWMAPLRPGDDLTLDVDVIEARVSNSRPETGIVTFKCHVRNATGQMLCEMVSPIIIRRRDAGRGSKCEITDAILRRSAIGQRREIGSFTFTADNDQGVRRAVRSAAVPSRRGGRPQLAVRRARGVRLAHRLGLHEAAGGRRPAAGGRGGRARRAGRGVGTVAGLSRSALDQAGAGRRHHQLRQRGRIGAAVRFAAEWGIVQARNTGTNQRGELVFSFLATAFVPRRPASVRRSATAVRHFNQMLAFSARRAAERPAVLTTL